MGKTSKRKGQLAAIHGSNWAFDRAGIGTEHISIVQDLKLKPLTREIRKKVADRIKKASESIVTWARYTAPYDAYSRNAAGKTYFPTMHHRDGIVSETRGRMAMKSTVKTIDNRGHIVEGPTRHYKSGEIMEHAHLVPAVSVHIPLLYKDLENLI